MTSAAFFPMNGPTGLIFAMRSRYNDQSGSENFYNEVDSAFSGQDAGFNALNGATDASVGLGTTAQRGSNPSVLDPSNQANNSQPIVMLTTLVKVSVPTTLKVWAKLKPSTRLLSASRKSP